MALPVVTVASGGLPVVDVTAGTPPIGMPVTEATNLRGLAVTKVTGGKPGLPVVYVSASGGQVATAWNPADKTAQIVLSNNNLTVAGSGSGTYNGVRSTQSRNSGKLYFEVALSGSGASSNVGIATSSADLTNLDNNNLVGAAGVSLSNAIFYVNGASIQTIDTAPLSIPSTLCLAMDFIVSRMWIRAVGGSNAGNWNGSAANNPTTNVGGVNIVTLFPSNAAFAVVSIFGTTSAVRTANFGATAFAQTMPGGFTAWG